MSFSIVGQIVYTRTTTPACPAGLVRFMLLSLLLSACAGQVDPVLIPEDARVQDLYIVDCLLPGQVRQLGKTTYMTPRRPVRTTAGECQIRGGEYVAYDRADYKTALKIWLPAAEAGDANAQNTVGEIFEQGLGTEANYEVAALWYERAAAQGHKGGLFNLGTLYETGNGVPKDKLKALNLYRKAWGLGDDALVYKSDAQRALIVQAQDNIRQQQRTTRKAASAIAAAEARGEKRGREMAVPARVTQTPAIPVRATKKQTKPVAVAENVTEPVTAKKKPAEPVRTTKNLAPPEEVSASGRNFGRYYALLIGNADYQNLDDLVTPVSDARRLGRLLEQSYGFRVRVVANGDDVSLLRAINKLNEELEENDNLLIYYSGHGNRRRSGAYETGYWLPVNADPAPNDTFWVPTEQVSGHLARLKARRIIVVADSSYAGLLADNPAFLLASDPANLRSQAYIDLRYPNRSRLLLTSGKDFPLQEQGDADVSVFADAFVDVLQSNNSVLTAPVLFLLVLDELEERQPELNPQFKTIKRAGDEVGDFFFVRKS